MKGARKFHPVFYLPFYFTMVNLAAVLAFSRFFSGDRQAVWEKAESARVAPATSPDQVAVPPPALARVSMSAESEFETATGPERVGKP